MKAFEIMNHLESYFPLHLQMDFDKCGIQVGNKQQEVHKVYLALNADNMTLQQCIDHGCDMLITHHPFMLEKINHLDFSSHQGKFVETAIKNDIVVYSLHTCLDRGQNGISMNDWLINLLDVHDVEVYDKYEVGKKAVLNHPMTGHEFVEFVEKAYNLKHLKYTMNLDKTIKTVAICGGSGAEDISFLAGEVDCYITGDTKYRHAKYAIDNDCLLIDPGHHLEVIFEKEVEKLLQSLDIDIVVAGSKDYYIYK